MADPRYNCPPHIKLDAHDTEAECKICSAWIKYQEGQHTKIFRKMFLAFIREHRSCDPKYAIHHKK